MEKSINTPDEKGLVAGECNHRKDIVDAVMKLKKNPLVSFLQPKYMRHNFWIFIDESIIQPDVSYIFVNYLFIVTKWSMTDHVQIFKSPSYSRDIYLS